jgi:hypothetical protein
VSIRIHPSSIEKSYSDFQPTSYIYLLLLHGLSHASSHLNRENPAKVSPQRSLHSSFQSLHAGHLVLLSFLLITLFPPLMTMSSPLGRREAAGGPPRRWQKQILVGLHFLNQNFFILNTVKIRVNCWITGTNACPGWVSIRIHPSSIEKSYSDFQLPTPYGYINLVTS